MDFSLVAGSGDWLLSSCRVVSSLVPEPWALRTLASVVAACGLSSCAHGLSCSRLVGSSQSRDGARISFIGRRILYHRAPREVENLQF